MCHEAIKLAYQNPGRTGLIGAPTYPMLRDATVAALIETLEVNRIPHVLNRAENYLTLPETRSRILFRAVEEFERLRGSNLAWFGLDELTYAPEDAWLRLEGRLRDPKAARLCGFAVWTPKGFDWVHERFLVKKVSGYETVIAQPFENRHLLAQVPDYYERLRHSYDARFYEQEVLGEYLAVQSGRVYYGFSRASNVAEFEADPNLALLWALDFNVDPMSSVVAQMVPSAAGGVVRVLDEIVLQRARTDQACEEFSRRYPAHPAGLVVYADATGKRMQTTGLSDVAVVQQELGRGEYGGAVEFKIPSGNPAVRDRVMAMNARLQPAEGAPLLTVHPRCLGLMRDFEQVVFKEGSLVIDKERDSKLTHLSDALGYLVWAELGGVGTVGERGRPLL